MDPPLPGTGFYLEGEPHVDPARLVAHYCASRGITPADLGIKPIVVGTWSRRLSAYLGETAGGVTAERWEEWKGEGARSAFVIGDAVTIVRFPIGAPAAVAMMEEMVACGMRTLITTGAAGSLQEHAPIGTIVVPTSAIREEGTSHHYAPHDVPAEPDAGVVERIAGLLDQRAIPYLQGENWTTDAIYREHRAKIDLYRRAGVVTVDMELSALWTVGTIRGVRCGAVVAVSDELHGETWELGFGGDTMMRGLTKAARVALDTALSFAAEKEA
jgi:uridine phosphorylase